MKAQVKNAFAVSRGTWKMNPVTRVKQSGKAYRRDKTGRNW